ncbi:DUF2867 domain-containing protein [Pseudorhodobacter sp. E13]|uniref:DUF2867 domain-containing protein n=1 Tax=Pseudorhodobacter sp. E13 TaxID=2487931 RepID=UPI000F8DC242|nr:DUF2867 domain-containing protein [Pseudorhodobacter sp. E13]RUS64975.1 DUF2867 domain-containing protein [Pseudorhodobacter sp. E13]
MHIPLVAPAEQLDYHNAQSLTLPRAITALEAWNIAMRNPVPGMAAAMWLRDRISGLFGVTPIIGFSGTQRANVQRGDRLDFFLVEDITDQLLVLTARDRHLDVMTTVTTYDQILTITSSVITHNRFGRAYMLPVGLAHKVIVWWILRKLAAELSQK